MNAFFSKLMWWKKEKTITLPTGRVAKLDAKGNFAGWVEAKKKP